MAERALVRRLAHAGPLTWLLAALAAWAMLAWLAALLGMGGRIAPVEAAAAGPLPVAKAPSADRLGPLSQYADAASRPLFTVDRRPRAFMATGPEGNEGQAATQTLDFILTGVLISPQVRLAILQPPAGGDSQRVHEGKSPEGAAGWRLVEVQPRRAVFEGAGGQATLDLRTFGSASNPATPGQGGKRDGDLTQVAPPPPPSPPPAGAGEQTEQQRIETIRKRIEARRAQLRAAQSNGGSSSSSTPSSNP